MIKFDAEKNGFRLFNTKEEFTKFYPVNMEPYPLNYPIKFPCLAHEGEYFWTDRDVQKYPMCYIYDFEIIG